MLLVLNLILFSGSPPVPQETVSVSEVAAAVSPTTHHSSGCLAWHLADVWRVPRIGERVEAKWGKKGNEQLPGREESQRPQGRGRQAGP